MGVNMVAGIERTTSTINSGKAFVNPGIKQGKTASTSSYYSDPDLLIREYFLSSPEQRAKSRKVIVKSISSLKSVIAVLKWGINGKARDAYDGAVDLLAEINDINLLTDTGKYLAALSELLINSPDNNMLMMLDSLWEIFIKGVGCAYHIPAEQRFRLLFNLIPASNRRFFKATVIDAFLLIADEMDTEPIKGAIGRYSSEYEADRYIRNYALEALEELSCIGD
ncbi:hypothetical protein IQ264_12590 [Phormidium sp. LEGE 05292]|uniref:hypothetical protein n=1 Tax=[Phormidium] sp. LEGE 05292 TaxID=767427 RepID=UPI001880B3F4|nr:hypothetical protein [Phormidium sp. LEGE 05292]MBE9226261.1 hypothetical protein [Phormidium sp. LEGE 05292]